MSAPPSESAKVKDTTTPPLKGKCVAPARRWLTVALQAERDELFREIGMLVGENPKMAPAEALPWKYTDPKGWVEEGAGGETDRNKHLEIKEWYAKYCADVAVQVRKVDAVKTRIKKLEETMQVLKEKRADRLAKAKTEAQSHAPGPSGGGSAGK
ncbi:hypothetical protein DFH27DRAFT_523782 [Peziza echinospora]|nr:hypothetical protein DFH27DRAFT_523782 [Peziza echinospora]